MNSWTNRLIEKAQKDGFPLTSLIDIDLATYTQPLTFTPVTKKAAHSPSLAQSQSLPHSFSQLISPHASSPFMTHFGRYQEWIQKGFHAEMKYLERGLDRRKNPRLLLPDAESILCVGIPYRRGAPHSSGKPKYARYLQGYDYHLGIKDRLGKIMEEISKECEFEKPLHWKICVDTSAVLERSWAALAGLGWIGKNTLLIHPKYGSYLFLAEVLINQKSGEGPKILPNYCGNCTRCLDACPTNALYEPGKLNAKDCISYLTLEKRGEWDKPDSFKKKMGTWVAGCDICQEVCPFNQKPLKMEETWPVSGEDAHALETDWGILEQETKEDYKKRIKRSSLERVRFEDFKRNLKNAKKNRDFESSFS